MTGAATDILCSFCSISHRELAAKIATTGGLVLSSSTDTAAAFVASYHRPPGSLLPGDRRRPVGMQTRERWAWFRIGVLVACRRWPSTTAALLQRFGIARRVASRRDTSGYRVALRNLALLVRRGFLVRAAEGYRATTRGIRVLDDLCALHLDSMERTP